MGYVRYTSNTYKIEIIQRALERQATCGIVY